MIITSMIIARLHKDKKLFGISCRAFNFVMLVFFLAVLLKSIITHYWSNNFFDGGVRQLKLMIKKLFFLKQIYYEMGLASAICRGWWLHIYLNYLVAGDGDAHFSVVTVVALHPLICFKLIPTYALEN